MTSKSVRIMPIVEEPCQWCGANEERAIMHVVDNYDGSKSAYLCSDDCLKDFMEEYSQ